MKYNYTNQIIPKDKRAQINQKLLSLIRLSNGNVQEMRGITKEDVFNAYTGIGGLHGYNFKDFDSYHSFKRAKMDFEEGQFFTPPDVCKEITDLFPISANDFVSDLCFGMGNFFNSLPNESACYGTEIDTNAYEITKFLYPNANISNLDIRLYEPQIKFDYIFGNPPFNLRWQIGSRILSSQEYYCEKAAKLLKPLGVMAIIVPETWLEDTHYYSGLIARLEFNFSFVCQYSLPFATQRKYGTDFPVKVMIWVKQSKHLESQKYANECLTYEQAKECVKAFLSVKNKLKAKIQSEKSESENDFKIKKWLYQIKTHPKLKSHYTKSLAYVKQLEEQTMPQWILDIHNVDERIKQWDKIKVTENRVIAYLKRVMNLQNKVSIDKTAWVQTKYGIKLKAYSFKAQSQIEDLEKRFYSYNSIILGENACVPMGDIKPILRRKAALYELYQQSILSLERDEKIDAYLNEFRFYKKEENSEELIACTFNHIQFNDLGLILQRPYAALNWSPGAGKTGAAYAWAKYNESTAKVRNVFVLSPAVAIDLTWKPFLTLQGQDFIQIKSFTDIQKIKVGQFVIFSNEMLVKYAKHIRQYVKKQAKKVAIICDESDEFTNRGSKRTRALFDCFRDVKRKLLTTGTLTRNRISELYAQYEFLFNNSINMICKCERYFEETKTDEGEFKIYSYDNKEVNKPFSAKHGNSLFSACFNPSKVSVFGVRKQNQDVYNEQHLREIISSFIVTRTFREIAGDKYTIHSIEVSQNDSEREVYRKIIYELHSVLPHHFQKTGVSRKDSMLRIIQQLNLLINATSMPQLIEGYNSIELPNKAKKILSLISEWKNERVAIGCISLDAVENYEMWIRSRFPDREVFVIQGKVTFKQRKRLISEFKASENGILICTQQSLRASVNIPFCDRVIIEAKQWNIPKMEQWYFRFIRYDSKQHTNVYFISYRDTIEMNLLALLMAKERLNDYIKTLDFKAEGDMYDKFGVDMDILSSLIEKSKEENGGVSMSWGKQTVVS